MNFALGTLAYMLVILDVVMIGILISGIKSKGYDNIDESLKIASVGVMLGILTIAPIVAISVIVS